MPLFSRPNVKRLKRKQDSAALVQALAYPDIQVRVDARKALSEIGEPAVKPLLDALNDVDYPQRAFAAAILVDMGRVEVAETLIAILKEKQPYDLKEALAKQLNRISPQAVDLLIAAYKQDKANLTIAIALGASQDQEAIKVLASASKLKTEDIRDNALVALGRAGTGGVKPLVRALSGERALKNCRHVAYSLIRIDTPEARDALIKMLSHENTSVRWAAVKAMDTTGWKPTGYWTVKNMYKSKPTDVDPFGSGTGYENLYED